MEAGGSRFRRCGYVKSSASQMEDQGDQFISLLNQKQMTFAKMWENVAVVLPERANNLIRGDRLCPQWMGGIISGCPVYGFVSGSRAPDVGTGTFSEISGIRGGSCSTICFPE